MHTYLIEMLECPVCHGKLEWSVLLGTSQLPNSKQMAA